MMARSDIGLTALVSIHPLKVDCPMFSPRGVFLVEGMCPFSSRELYIWSPCIHFPNTAEVA